MATPEQVALAEPLPVRALAGNILAALESARASTRAMHQQAVAQALVNPGIGYDAAPGPARGPRVVLGSRKIVVQEAFLGYLWAITYALVVTEQEGWRRSLLRARGLPFDPPDASLLADAEALFRWAMKLRTGWTPWPAGLPRPGMPETTAAGVWAGKVNALFVDAAAYLLFHEYAHLVLRQADFVEQMRRDAAPGREWTEAERASFIEMERDADVFARAEILGDSAPSVEGSPGGSIRLLQKGLAIVVAHAAGVLLVPEPGVVRQRLHPDLDHRVFDALAALNADPNGPLDALWTAPCLALLLFFGEWRIEHAVHEADDAPQLLEQLLRRLDQEKSRWPHA